MLTELTLPELYAFDGAYSRCFEHPEIATDKRHIFMLREVLSYGFKHALEIGSFYGASSTAFVEALNAKELERVTLCDHSPYSSLMQVIAKVCVSQQWNRIAYLKAHSTFALDVLQGLDFVFVDGSHDLQSVGDEIKRLSVIRPKCIMAHDTSATENGYEAAEGAKFLKEHFTRPGWFTVEDNKQRIGEETHRGLFLATTDPALHEHAKAVFAKWGDA